MGLKLPKYMKTGDVNIAHDTAQLGHTAGEVQPFNFIIVSILNFTGTVRRSKNA